VGMNGEGVVDQVCLCACHSSRQLEMLASVCVIFIRGLHMSVVYA
jgi:hypothetical protein